MHNCCTFCSCALFDECQHQPSARPDMRRCAVRFLGACADVPSLGGSATLAIVMELCRRGALHKLIRLARRVSRLPGPVKRGEQPPQTREQQQLRVSLSLSFCSCTAPVYHGLLKFHKELHLVTCAAACIAALRQADGGVLSLSDG